MGNLQWFRMYKEFATDPKIQSMDETSQRRFVMLLCLRCDDDLVKLNDDEIACALRIDLESLSETKELFIKKGFIDDNWAVLKWDKRQYKSDNSTERTRVWRERQKECGIGDVTETSQKRHGDDNVTPPDTDTDNNPPIVPPKKKFKLPDWVNPEVWREWKEFRSKIKAPLTGRAIARCLNELDKLRQNGDDPNKILERSIDRGWKGVFPLNGDKPKQKMPSYF